MSNELLGRSTGRAAGRRFLESAERRPACLIIEGEPGIGKSTLWQSVVDDGSTQGWRVLTSRPSELEADLAHASLTDLLLPVAEEVRADLAPPQRRALDAVLLAADLEQGAVDPRAVGMALTAVLRTLAARTRVIVAVDDLHWVDAASVRALSFAIRRLIEERVGLLVTRRSGSVESLLRTVEQAFSDEQLQTVRLGPMSLGAIHQLIESRFGASLPRPSLVQLERASGGNPLAALVIVDALRRAGRELAPDAIAPAPAEIERTVAGWIYRLPAETQSALLAVAALGRPSLDVLQAVIGTGDVRSALSPAIHDGILQLEGQRVRFVHPLYRSAVYGAEPRDRRSELHRRISRRLSDPDEACLHLALATAVPDSTVAAVISQGAADAYRRGALDGAAVLYEHALRLTAHDAVTVRVDRMLTLAAVLWELGDIERSKRLTSEALRHASGGRARGVGLVLKAMHGLWTEGPAAAMALYHEALPFVSDDPALEATVHLRIAYAADDDLSLAATHAAAAVELLETQPQASDLRACALLMRLDIDVMRGRPLDPVAGERARAMLSRLPQSVDPGVPFDAGAIARERSWLLRAAADDLDVARDELDTVRRHDAERGLDRSAPIVHMDLTDLHCQLGDVRAARTNAQQAVQLSRQTGRLPYAEAAAHYATALVAEHVGDVAGAVEAARAAHRLASGLGPAPLLDRVNVLFARLELARDRPSAAADLLMTLDARLQQTGMRQPGAHRFRGDLVESLVAAGRVDEAALQAARLAAGVETAPTPWGLAISGRSRAIVAAASGDLDAAIRWLQAALTHHDRLAMPVERGRTLLHLGRAMRRKRRKRAAAHALGAALATFEAAGAVHWVSRARAELDRAGVGPRTGGELTATEREVARLAGAGMTNRQVADAMILSPKSIDGVLTRVYAKLGIHSRAELGARMAGERAHTNG